MKKQNFLFVIIGVLLGSTLILSLSKNNDEKINPNQLQVQAVNYLPPKTPENFVEAADKTVNSVVHIKTKMRRKNSVYDFYYDFFGHPHAREHRQPMYQASGSGVIISKDGYIITNNHVVENADEIEVILNDKRKFTAKIIGTDPSTDLAVIKIEAEDLAYLQFGNSDEVKVGEWVLAVGNPFNLTSTVTAGIVSAKARNINILGRENNSAIESFIQTDAAVNPGNSGGALVDTKGLLIGINAAIASNTGSYTGYAFAIPSNLAKKVVADLIQYGESQRGYLGVSIAEMTEEIANDIGIDAIKGVYLAKVLNNGAAHEAGIPENSVILKVNNQVVNSPSELMAKIGEFRPGEILNIDVFSDGEVQNYSLQLRNMYGNTEIVNTDNSSFIKELGASFQKPDEDLMQGLNIKYGMQIQALQSGALRVKGIQNGFIILRMNKLPIHSIADIKDVINGVQGGLLIEGIYPNGLRVYYGIGLK